MKSFLKKHIVEPSFVQLSDRRIVAYNLAKNQKKRSEENEKNQRSNKKTAFESC